jgi:hypothetical protein
MGTYDSRRRSPRGGHRRVVKVGTERFAMNDDDEVKEGFSVTAVADSGDFADRRVPGGKNAEDDERILTELPPHWAVFNERE